MLVCALTGQLLETPLYSSPGRYSVTSLSQLYDGETTVYLNSEIAHLQTRQLKNLDQYYDKDYQIFDQSDEDDVLYKVENDVKIFRQEHQLNTLLQKIDFKEGIEVLDYGCAKGTVMKRLQVQYPFIRPYLFDVSRMYTKLWDRFTNADHYASYSPKDSWKGKFDVITSFFAFEHTPDPLKELRTIKTLLKPDGLVYILVPNVFDNVGDFIVADHVHHYSKISLRYMMEKSGFVTVEIDDQSHFAAFIVVARNQDKPELENSDPAVADINLQLAQIGSYWQEMASNIAEFESKHTEGGIAIYGAGVYGNFIATCLQNPEQIHCFVDQNPLLVGTHILEKPVLKPQVLPDSIKTVYVGLNPKIAHQVIDNIDVWKKMNLTFFFL